MNLQVCSAPTSSVEISLQVERLVQERTNGQIRNLRVDVADSYIVLTGRATTYYAKQMATHAAFEMLMEDFSLRNEIDVC
ncbi:MAG: hypothetical protein KDA79_04395 [Planctomycetaceae bacterium]|nr:hypothetical protein [Planctomycetaceae bacterium]